MEELLDLERSRHRGPNSSYNRNKDDHVLPCWVRGGDVDTQGVETVNEGVDVGGCLHHDAAGCRIAGQSYEFKSHS